MNTAVSGKTLLSKLMRRVVCLHFIFLYFLLNFAFVSATTTLTYTSDSSFVVPSGVTSITVKAWGAGGGSNTYTPFGGTAAGGGGYVKADVSVTAGNTLQIKVGTGGAAGTPATSGGLTGIFLGSVTHGNSLVVVGSGGSGGTWNNGNGGAGGGSTGAAATSGGGGGTQVAGGAGGVYGGAAGSALTGGAPGGSYSQGGGYGGAGYYGGGGGGTVNGGSFYQGGGGGSSYIISGSTNITNTQASGQTPPNTGDSDYPGSSVAYGGGVNASGYRGHVVISYVNPYPIVSTSTVVSIASTGATLGATLESIGSSSVTARGICYGISPSPTTNCTAEGGTATGTYTQSITGLATSTTYYFRGYATNSYGTAYSEDSTFTTEGLTNSLMFDSSQSQYLS
ncbi:hypothetical protein K9M47_03305, partial [Candidatus Gracilibacteria bacterium]|nr:hypothetical protein [Candidatus Gracilibacteria bacterium]